MDLRHHALKHVLTTVTNCRCVKLVLNGVAQGSAEVVVASHSQSSVENTVKEMVALDMKAGAPVYFAQLFGMADYLTYSLALHGYKVSSNSVLAL